MNINFLFMTILVVLIPNSISDCDVCRCILHKGVKTAFCSKAFNPLDRFDEHVNIVHFTNQNFQNISNSKLAHLKNIQKLFLINSQIQNIDENAFHHLTVVTLDLSHNIIQDLKLNTFQNVSQLKYLKLGNNNIKIIQNGLFTNLHILEEISLENNQISVIEEHAFANNYQLRSLDLSGNQLRRLNVNLGKKLSDLEHLDLARNPWTCNCQTKDMLQDLWNYHFVNDAPECFYPQLDKHIPWSELKPEDYSCFPKVIVDSNLKVIRENETVILDCKVESFYRTLIKWIVNDKLVSDSSSDKIIPVGGTTHVFWFNLTVYGHQWHGCTTFNCVADNVIGNEQQNVQVIVDRDLPVIMSPKNESIQADTENVIITCLVYSKTKLLTKQTWFYKHSMEDRHPLEISHKRGKYESYSPDANQITEYKMTIFNITSKDAGVYTFVAENEFGQAENSIELNVNSSLSVQILQSRISVNLGAKNYTLQCKVISIEYPVVDWFYNEKQLINGDKYVFGENKTKVTYLFSLTVNHLNKNDGGLYTCKGKNSLGNQTQQQILEIRYKDPQVELEDKWFGDELRLTCKVESIPKSSVTWYFDDDNISNNVIDKYTITYRAVDYTTIYILTIPNVGSNELGNYSCHAENGLNSSSRYYVLSKTNYERYFTTTNIIIVCVFVVLILIIIFGSVKYFKQRKTLMIMSNNPIPKHVLKNHKEKEEKKQKEFHNFRHEQCDDEVDIEMQEFIRNSDNLQPENYFPTNFETPLNKETSSRSSHPPSTFSSRKTETQNTDEEASPIPPHQLQIPSTSGSSRPVKSRRKSSRKIQYSQSSSSADESINSRSYATTNIPAILIKNNIPKYPGEGFNKQ